MDQRRRPGAKRAGRDLYLVKSVVHASEVLSACRPGEALRLRDVVDRTGLGKGMCFRLLFTLHDCGFVTKVEGNRYRMTSEVRRRRRYRITTDNGDHFYPNDALLGVDTTPRF